MQLLLCTGCRGQKSCAHADAMVPSMLRYCLAMVQLYILRKVVEAKLGCVQAYSCYRTALSLTSCLSTGSQRRC